MTLTDWFNANWERIARTVIHAALMGAAIYIAAHPQYAIYVPVIQYLGNAIDAAR